MKKLLDEIMEYLNNDDPTIRKAELQISETVKELLQPLESELSPEQLESVTETAYRISAASEKIGAALGVQLIFRLLKES